MRKVKERNGGRGYQLPSLPGLAAFAKASLIESNSKFYHDYPEAHDKLGSLAVEFVLLAPEAFLTLSHFNGPPRKPPSRERNGAAARSVLRIAGDILQARSASKIGHTVHKFVPSQ